MIFIWDFKKKIHEYAKLIFNNITIKRFHNGPPSNRIFFQQRKLKVLIFIKIKFLILIFLKLMLIIFFIVKIIITGGVFHTVDGNVGLLCLV